MNWILTVKALKGIGECRLGKKAASGIMLVLLTISMVSLATNVKPAKSEWTGTVYIRADGSIDPPDAPIMTYDNVTYTLTGDIASSADGIVVERNNIIIDGAGYTLRGPGASFIGSVGMNFSSITNVTARNINVKHFAVGIILLSSGNNTLAENNITNNRYGFWLTHSSNNTVSRNNIEDNNILGIALYDCSTNNFITGNNITTNNGDGIEIFASFNTIYNNSITNNAPGIWLHSNNNNISKNNLENNNIGLYFRNASENNISENNISLSQSYGILIDFQFGISFNNTFLRNKMNGNRYGFGFGFRFDMDSSINPLVFVQSIDTSNLINGEPIYYLINQTNIRINSTMYPQVGYLALINCFNVTVEDLAPQSNEESILLAYTNGSRIAGNTVINSEYGIALYSSYGNVISENNITLAEDDLTGILLSYSSNNTVYENTITNSVVGIHLKDSSDNNLLYKNNLTDNGNAICLGNSCIGNYVFLNNIRGNSGSGVYISGPDNKIYKNDIISNGWGIRLNQGKRNSIYENNIISNQYYGILIDCEIYSSPNNSIYHNSFIDNSVQASISTSTAKNNWDRGYPIGGNYWSDYTGIDEFLGPLQNATGSDGIGDTPYAITTPHVINEYVFDRYPLMKPWTPPHITVLNFTASKTVIGESYSLSVAIILTNQGNNTENLNVTIYANETVIAFQTFLLGSGYSVIYNFIWSTTSFAKGNYTIWAYIQMVSGGTVLDYNSLFCGWVLVSIPGDVVEPYFEVDIYDITAICVCYGSEMGDPDYYADCDVDGNGIIDIYDVTTACITYGQKIHSP